MPGEAYGEQGEESEADGPEQALSAEREIGFDEGGVGRECEQRGQVGKAVEAVRYLPVVEPRSPDLQKGAGGSQGQEWKADGERQAEENGGGGVGGESGGVGGREAPGDCREKREGEQGGVDVSWNVLLWLSR